MPFKTEELVFDLKPEILHGKLGALSVHSFNKIQRDARCDLVSLLSSLLDVTEETEAKGRLAQRD